MRLAIAVVIVAGLAGAARAGDICGDDRRVDLHVLEQHASQAFHGDLADVRLAAQCLGNDHPHADRIVAACTKILDRDHAFTDCFVLAAMLGRTVAGTHDVFAWVAKLPLDPWEVNVSMPDYPLFLFQHMGDARAVPLIVAMWRASIPKADQKQKRHRSEDMAEWSGWRQNAAATLGQLGGPNELPFLDEQAAATVDIHVAEACRAAATAISKRLVK